MWSHLDLKKQKPNITQTTFLSGFKETILMGGKMDAYNIIVKKLILHHILNVLRLQKKNIKLISIWFQHTLIK